MSDSNISKTHKIRNTIFLLLTALIWGAAFVAQSVSMDYIEPMTFICLRSFIGGVFLIPVIWFLDFQKKQDRGLAAKPFFADKWTDKKVIEGGIACGLCLFLANCFQQTGIQYTTVGKAGFITSFYIIIVPLLGLFFKKYCGILTWISVVVALTGLYFLCINEALHIQKGDFMILVSAFFFAAQILVIDHYNQFVDGVKMSCIQFLTGAVLAFFAMVIFEDPQWAMIVKAAVPILYTGIMSTGVGYTLQIVGQKGLNPTVAALILSLESVFSALSGFVILHQILSARELIGCTLMFGAIILAQLPDFRQKKY